MKRNIETVIHEEDLSEWKAQTMSEMIGRLAALRDAHGDVLVGVTLEDYDGPPVLQLYTSREETDEEHQAREEAYEREEAFMQAKRDEAYHVFSNEFINRFPQE